MNGFKEIAELAWFISKENSSSGKVDLYAILERKQIGLIEGNYGEHFLGELQHCSGQFFIYLNKDKLQGKEHPRTRFTVAHELGHYFIDAHRNILQKGISLSYSKSKSSLLINNQVELEANHFASHLLMPAPDFLSVFKMLPQGIESIIGLKSFFQTSFECTAIHYIKLDLTASILIKWNPDCSIKYYLTSDRFHKLTGLPTYSLKFDKTRMIDEFKMIEQTQPPENCIESATKLSRWIGSISPNGSNDILGLEQSIRMEEYGGYTLLTF